jgi:hypothetical protein
MKRAGLWKHMVCLEISWVESWGDLNRWFVFKACVWPTSINLIWISHL